MRHGEDGASRPRVIHRALYIGVLVAKNDRPQPEREVDELPIVRVPDVRPHAAHEMRRRIGRPLTS